MTTLTGKCTICTNILPLEGHHAWPQEYGGQDDTLVNICGGCHVGVHRAADAVLTDKSYDKDFPDARVRERARPFIELIVIAKLTFEAKGGKATNVKRRIIIQVDSPTLLAIHKVKKDRGFKSLQALWDSVIQALTINVRVQ
jgi:hypothetical protein